jgi:uncharacterized protein YndB with AHSA1/START domain
MKLEILLREFYPHPVKKVWAALTDSAALAAWLMRNDFVPRIGHRFTFVNEPRPGWRGRVECEVVTLEPPSRMVWSWLGTDEGAPTLVEFRLEAVAGGTRLTLEHTGDTDPVMRSLLTPGWSTRFAELRIYLMKANSK